MIHAVADFWHCPPMTVLEAPAWMVRRAWFYHSVKNQAEHDRIENERALAKAYQQ
jgi:hypothetical protein